MADTPEKGNANDFEKWVHIVTLAGKFFLTIGLVSYVLGVLTANMYFGKFGIAAVSLLRITYFLTGAWILMQFCVSGLLVAAIGHVIEERSFSKKYKIEVVLLVFLIMVVLLWKFNYILNSYLGIDATFSWLRHLYQPLLIMGVVMCYMYAIRSVLKQKMEDHQKVYWYSISSSLVGALLIVVTLIYLVSFAKNVYPSIPSCLGGAKPTKVHVFIDPNSEVKNSFNSCGLSWQKDGSWEGKLILATDTELFFSVKDANEALCIKREEVKAIKYYPAFKLSGNQSN